MQKRGRRQLSADEQVSPSPSPKTAALAPSRSLPRATDEPQPPPPSPVDRALQDATAHAASPHATAPPPGDAPPSPHATPSQDPHPDLSLGGECATHAAHPPAEPLHQLEHAQISEQAEDLKKALGTFNAQFEASYNEALSPISALLDELHSGVQELYQTRQHEVQARLQRNAELHERRRLLTLQYTTMRNNALTLLKDSEQHFVE